MVVYLVVIEVMENLLNFLGKNKKIYIIEIIYHKLNNSAGVEGADWTVDSKQPDIKGNERKLYIYKTITIDEYK